MDMNLCSDKVSESERERESMEKDIINYSIPILLWNMAST